MTLIGAKKYMLVQFIAPVNGKGANFVTIGNRLKEERQRLGFSQTAFAELAEASKRSIIGWEKGDSSPNANALSAFAEAGADVLYIVTGRRLVASGAPKRSAYSAEAAMDEIDSAHPSSGAFHEKLRDYAVDVALPDRTRARADHLLASLGDEDAKARLKERARMREDAFERARRIVREARFVVDWEPPERLEAELIRLVVDTGVEARQIEELLRAVRDGDKS